MRDEQEAFLSYFNTNLHEAKSLIEEQENGNRSGQVRENFVNAKQYAGWASALIDCELRKTYGKFCDLCNLDSEKALERYNEFISAATLWRKALDVYKSISELEVEAGAGNDSHGQISDLVAQQLERRKQRKNATGANFPTPNLIESSMDAVDVQNILSRSSVCYYWSPLLVTKDPTEDDTQVQKSARGDFACLKTLGSRLNAFGKRPLEDNDYHRQEFITAYEKLTSDALNNKNAKDCDTSQNMYHAPKMRPGPLSRPFVSPLSNKCSNNTVNQAKGTNLLSKDPRFEKLNKDMVSSITGEILENVAEVTWDSIAGLEHAKNIIKETVVWPMLRPDIFTGIRGPPKGILLFGPPGTGKTLIGKFIASQCKATFFSISSSSLTSKWIGEGEKMVRTLFSIAQILQPSVIFVDEVDSLLSQRNETENEATRRMKTEFLVQFDGCNTKSEDRVLLIGATNRPDEIDEAARRRFRKKLYIPLPEGHARASIIRNLLSQQNNVLNDDDIQELVSLTDGYSGFDVDGLVREAAMGPIREISDISTINSSELRSIGKSDFISALTQIKASVSHKELSMYEKFNEVYGSVSK